MGVRAVPPLTTAQAARYLGVSVSTLNRWRASGRGPVAITYEPGRIVRYELYELERFKAAGRSGHGA
ncbi:helix-turn-helix domain-containing protein [Bifidobacterium pseudolongum subsp. globosum]|uniref:helix-turn-helix domain-containing protein n=1 Tax=Bifidobacterium pseudolongum TaxID=1694 RepID=UPI0039931AEF